METNNLYEFGPFRLDGRRKSLTRNGGPIPLPGKALDVLYVLLREHGRTVLKDELMKEVWADTFVEEGNLTQMIFLLRKALEDTVGARPLITTIPRQGYRFVGDLSPASFAGEKTMATGRIEPPALAAHQNKPTTLKSGSGYNGLRLTGVAVASGLVGWLIAQYHFRETRADSHLIRYTIAPEKGTTYTIGTISPDGRSLALMGIDTDGKTRLWVRRLDALAGEPLAEAELWPFWSPDSRFVAFANDGKLKKIEAAGGPAQTICSAELVIGGSWNREGTIIFSDGIAISRIEAAGGEAHRITALDNSRAETAHEFPIFLPDGRHFFYTIHSGKKDYGGIYLGSLDAPNARVRLLADVSNAGYAPPPRGDSGYLLFARGDVLMAQKFSPGSFRLTGEAFAALPGTISRSSSNLNAPFSASENGVLLVTPPILGDQVTWFDRTGKRLGTIGKSGLHFYPQLSPNEQTVALDEIDPERFLSDIWLYPAARGSASRLTFNGLIRPVWSPDGGRVAYEAMNEALYSRTIAGTENEVQVLKPLNRDDDYRLPCEWSRDGRFLIYSERAEKTGYDLWLLPLFGDHKPVPFLHSEYNEGCGTLSPDSKWIAYASDESGKNEIYVQAFSILESNTNLTRKWQVSDKGGHWPKWRGDGKELLYLSEDREVTAVEVAAGAVFRHGAPQRLFASGIRTPDARFDVTNDGTRFLIPTVVNAANAELVSVNLNWMSAVNHNRANEASHD